MGDICVDKNRKIDKKLFLVFIYVLNIETNKSLLNYNTFGIKVFSKFFAEIKSLGDVQNIIHDKNFSDEKILVLGGGSNILFTKDFDGLVLKNDISGIEVISEDENSIEVRVGAGNNWHQFVQDCVTSNYGGLENLSLIPGNVGASPMQNIGAYGVEVKDRVTKVEFIDLKTGEEESLRADECEFGYRTSVFKTSLAGQKFIHHVSFKLSKNPVLNTSYGAIEQELERMGESPTIASVSQAVINIRRSKLPNPAEIGNAGSFFKNPVIDSGLAEKLKNEYPDMPQYPAGEGQTKVAAGWLIEKAGWKGKRFDGHGVHAKQALVLVNYGGASGSDVNHLADQIKDSIHNQFGIDLEKEVNIL